MFFTLSSFAFSDDGGSDSSIDDGLPKHLEVIAAAKVKHRFVFESINVFPSQVRLKKPRKKKAPAKGTKDSKNKDENDKENNDKVSDPRPSVCLFSV